MWVSIIEKPVSLSDHPDKPEYDKSLRAAARKKTKIKVQIKVVRIVIFQVGRNPRDTKKVSELKTLWEKCQKENPTVQHWQKKEKKKIEWDQNIEGTFLKSYAVMDYPH